MSKFVSCLEVSDPFLAMNMELSMMMESFQVPVTEDLKAVKNFIVEKAKKLWDWICEWADKIKDKISEFLEKMPAFKEREIEDLILDPDKLDVIDDIVNKIEAIADNTVFATHVLNEEAIRKGLNALDMSINQLEKLKKEKRAKKKGSYAQAKKWCLQLQAKSLLLKQRTKVIIEKWKTMTTFQNNILSLAFNKQSTAMALIVGVLNHDISVLRAVSLRPEKEDTPAKKPEAPKYKALPAGA
ncbi:MAG: hypothetical protein J6W96_01440 [Alphaproteobacteria bacterium]|nr:hypothetical protein [Alphaproteobacteria bacterium]